MALLKLRKRNDNRNSLCPFPIGHFILFRHFLQIGIDFQGRIVFCSFPHLLHTVISIHAQGSGNCKSITALIERALDEKDRFWSEKVVEAEKRGAERMMSEEICMHLLQCPQCQEFSKIADNWKSLAGELLLSLIDAEESSHAEFCGMGCHNMKEHLEKIPIIAKAREMGAK